MKDADLNRIRDQKRASLGLTDETVPTSVTARCCACGTGITVEVVSRAAAIQGEIDAGRGPKVLCGPCAQARREKLERDAQQAARQELLENVEAVLAGVGVPAAIRIAALELCPDLPADLVRWAAMWAKAPRGIVLLCGPAGAGKSWAAVAMLRQVLTGFVLPPSGVVWTSEREYLAAAKAAFGTGGAPNVKVLRARLLVVDDVFSSRATDWARDEMADLIEARHACGEATVFTSNLAPEEIGRDIDPRLASRLVHHRQVFRFPGKDLRAVGSIRPEGAA